MSYKICIFFTHVDVIYFSVYTELCMNTSNHNQFDNALSSIDFIHVMIV